MTIAGSPLDGSWKVAAPLTGTTLAAPILVPGGLGADLVGVGVVLGFEAVVAECDGEAEALCDGAPDGVARAVVGAAACVVAALLDAEAAAEDAGAVDDAGAEPLDAADPLRPPGPASPGVADAVDEE